MPLSVYMFIDFTQQKINIDFLDNLSTPLNYSDKIFIFKRLSLSLLYLGFLQAKTSCSQMREKESWQIFRSSDVLTAVPTEDLGQTASLYSLRPPILVPCFWHIDCGPNDH